MRLAYLSILAALAALLSLPHGSVAWAADSQETKTILPAIQRATANTTFCAIAVHAAVKFRDIEFANYRYPIRIL